MKQVTLPKMPVRMQAVKERDARGYPIAFTQHYKLDGTPDFTIIDANKTLRCAIEKLCGLCGSSLKTPSGFWLPMAFVGGILSTHKTHMFVEAPMHLECATWAIGVCPWLCLKSYRRERRPDDPDYAEMSRPFAFGILKCRTFETYKTSDGGIIFKAINGHVVKTWKPGSTELVTKQEIDDHLKQYELP